MKRRSLAELREQYLTRAEPMSREVERELERDERDSVRKLLAQLKKRQINSKVESQRLADMLVYERRLWETGVEYVAGVDEAGVGPLAGPIAAGAVVLKPDWRYPGIDDSKKLSPKARSELEAVIKAEALAYAVAFVEPAEIDALNPYWAAIAAMERAVSSLGLRPGHLLVDARKLERTGIPFTAIIKGDRRSLSIAAASILAKTARDRLMVAYDAEYPGYGFAKHMGYPVPEHRAALLELGPCAIHRRSYAPVQESLRARGGGATP